VRVIYTPLRPLAVAVAQVVAVLLLRPLLLLDVVLHEVEVLADPEGGVTRRPQSPEGARMTTDQDALDTAARTLHMAKRATQEALACVATDQLEETEALLREASQRQQTALGLLVDVLGAKRPGLSVSRDALPLEMLNTPATRAYLAALEEATRAAEAVDRERGWIDEDGECIGFGETLAGMVLGLRREVFGARGRGME